MPEPYLTCESQLDQARIRLTDICRRLQIPLSGPSHVVVIVSLGGQRWVCDHGYAGAVYLPTLLEDRALTDFCRGEAASPSVCVLQLDAQFPVICRVIVFASHCGTVWPLFRELCHIASYGESTVIPNHLGAAA